jgi:hypothetical protein
MRVYRVAVTITSETEPTVIKILAVSFPTPEPGPIAARKQGQRAAKILRTSARARYAGPGKALTFGDVFFSNSYGAH